MGSIDRAELRQGLIAFLELAYRAEQRELGEKGTATTEKVLAAMGAYRRWRDQQRAEQEIAFLVKYVVAPAYRAYQEKPDMGADALQARLMEEARKAGFELTDEALDELVVPVGEVTGPGPVVAATEIVGRIVHRSDRTVMKWYAEGPASPPTVFARSSVHAANLALYVVDLLRLEAEAEDQGRAAERLSKAFLVLLETMSDSPAVAPPPAPSVPPEVSRAEDDPD